MSGEHAAPFSEVTNKGLFLNTTRFLDSGDGLLKVQGWGFLLSPLFKKDLV